MYKNSELKVFKNIKIFDEISNNWLNDLLGTSETLAYNVNFIKTFLKRMSLNQLRIWTRFQIELFQQGSTLEKSTYVEVNYKIRPNNCTKKYPQW